jgi:hypothetical protein
MIEGESAVTMGGKRTLDEISSNEEDNNDNATMRDGSGTPTSKDETASNGDNNVNVNNDSDAMVRRFIHIRHYKNIYSVLLFMWYSKI